MFIPETVLFHFSCSILGWIAEQHTLLFIGKETALLLTYFVCEFVVPWHVFEPLVLKRLLIYAVLDLASSVEVQADRIQPTVH